MKNRMLVLFCTILLIISIILGGSTTNKKAIEEEEFYNHWIGTWVNTDLQASSTTPQKIICYADGTLEYYSNAKHLQQLPTHTFTLIESWEDSKGNIWFKATEVCPLMETPIQEYGKINVSDSTFERIYEYSNDPIEKWDPDNTKYFHVIYYHQ